jgi:allantoicase
MLEGIFRTAGGFWFATLLRWACDAAEVFVVRVEATEPEVAVRVLGGLLVLASDDFLGSTGRLSLTAFEPVRSLASFDTTELEL